MRDAPSQTADSRTLQHVWLAILVFGGLLECPLCLWICLRSSFGGVFLVRLIREGLTTLLRTYPLRGPQSVHFIDLPETPWFVHPTPPPGDAPQFIHLMHPHGLFSEVGGLYARNRTYPSNTVLLVDPILYRLSPLCSSGIEYATGLRVSYMKHSNISALLSSGHSLIVFVGGFDEAVDFQDGEETVCVDRYQYWMKMSKRYSTELWTTIFYDGSARYYRQSSWGRRWRRKFAQYRIPCVLPTGIRFPKDQVPVYTRHLQWVGTTDYSNSDIEARITATIDADRTLQKSVHVVTSNL
jgi:hypothetical protein